MASAVDAYNLKDKVAFTHDFGLVRNLSQGAFNFTNNTYDLALQGEGYFEIQGRNGGASTYTRAGNFTLSAEGQIVTQQGYVVQPPISVPAR